KNAILVVEFAKELHLQGGKSVFDATLEASRLRLRPILMTSFAFILGVVPLCVASGAGAEMRRTLGTAVFSGMLGVTAFGIFLTPVFFYAIDRLGGLGLFESEWLRRVSGAVLAVISLAPLRHRDRRAARPAWNGAAKRPVPQEQDPVLSTQYSVVSTESRPPASKS